MATPTGAVTFEAGGRTRTLRFSTNALCLAEEHLGKRTLEIATELEMGVGVRTLRALFWAGGDDQQATMAQVGDLIDEIGVRKATDLALDAFAAAFPVAEEGGEGNPR
ncbi:hypothetical protein [Sphingomonas carotinifaciens]|uniref:hypothetical protein n=1 Tax=Sphingomonas carotinifaciens TaxID=1166323 RepID=UPI000DD65AC5|nr:hypothetical protein [Sphingomonas carotinifaciens]